MAKLIANQTFRVATETGTTKYVKEGQIFNDSDDIVVGREDLFDTVEGAAYKRAPKTKKTASSAS